jgi:hypothetical protein
MDTMSNGLSMAIITLVQPYPLTPPPPILPHGRRGLTIGHAPAHAATLASMLDRGVAGPCRHAPPPAPRPSPP